MSKRPWQMVFADSFEYEQQQYLVLYDYYHNYFEMMKRSKITASNVVPWACKEHFARHGIPDVLVSDAGTQFTSKELLRFLNHGTFATRCRHLIIINQMAK